MGIVILILTVWLLCGASSILIGVKYLEVEQVSLGEAIVMLIGGGISLACILTELVENADIFEIVVWRRSDVE